jgi:hypothetical protein
VKHPFSWNKVAVVGERQWWDRLLPIASALMPGEMRHFETAELQTAREWLQSGS